MPEDIEVVFRPYDQVGREGGKEEEREGMARGGLTFFWVGGGGLEDTCGADFTSLHPPSPGLLSQTNLDKKDFL